MRLEDIARVRYAAGPSRDLMVPTSELSAAQKAEAGGMYSLIADLAPEARTIMGKAFDSALAMVTKAMGRTDADIWAFDTGYKAGGWTVPDEWVLNGSSWGGFGLPLSIVSYSRSVDESGTPDELRQKGVLHTHSDRPNAAPYIYNFYDREGGPAGNCMSQRKLNSVMLTPPARMGVRVESTFRPGVLRLLRTTAGAEDRSIPIIGHGTNIVFMAHLDHPGQANDGLSGVAVLTALHNWIRQQQECGRKFKYTYEFVIVPESIGSACYLSRRTPGYGNILGAVVLDLVGGRGHLLLQHSLQHATDRPAPYIDRVMEYAAAMTEPAFAVAPYRAIVRGDDANLNGPRYRIPTVVLARWPFAEYHTSDDDITTISPAYLLRTLDVMKAAVNILEHDFRPNPTSAGRPFLYGAGLWADPDGKGQVVDDLMERFVLLADGDKQVMDIAEELGMPLRKALEMAEMMRGAGLLTR